jgi:hypothetical protein
MRDCERPSERTCTLGLAAKHKRSGSASFCDALNAELWFASGDCLRNSGPVWLS